MSSQWEVRRREPDAQVAATSAHVRGALVVSIVVIVVGLVAPRPITAIVVQTAGVAGVCAYAIGRLRNEEPQMGWLHPGILVFLFLSIVYVGRPLYILHSEQFGTHQLGRYTMSTALPAMSAASFVILGAVLAFTVGFFLLDAPPRGLMSRLASRTPAVGGKLMVLFLVSLVAAFAVLAAIQASFTSWRTALSLRADLFAGQQYLIFVLQAYKYGFLLWLGSSLLAWRKDGLTLDRCLLAVALWTPSFFFDFLTGSRADLIYRNLIPLAAVVLLTSGAPRVRLRALIVPVLMAATLFVVIRIEVRDQAAADAAGTSASPSGGVQGALADLPEFILEGDEASVYDAYVIISGPAFLKEGGRGTEGISSVLLAPVPSRFIDKPPRSTTYFTEKVRPDLARRGGNIAISGLGDAYLTLGNMGGIVIYGLLGVLTGAVIRRCAAATRVPGGITPPLLIGFAAAAATLPVLRADLAELSLFPLRVGIPVLICWWLTARRSEDRMTSAA